MGHSVRFDSVEFTRAVLEVLDGDRDYRRIHALTVRRQADGVPEGLLIDVLTGLMLDMRSQGREAEEELVMEALDHVTGWYGTAASYRMRLHEIAELVVDLPEHDLRSGAVGTVVDEYPTDYEVEFVDDDGRTTALLTLRPDQLRFRGRPATGLGASAVGEARRSRRDGAPPLPGQAVGTGRSASRARISCWRSRYCLTLASFTSS
ncbi:DUF4926 domain-containing protein [Actinosynnema sp. NPDC047251]|uniref:DUF4926 domain-containing protein n=1 Tax=Saccharothrix espanaensis (strain ATCC 51144 / DSM 44229 / JCM 9112 / NBRC 15066 / NRRL 15764) TaxID=1179773 RepID=K0JYU6_SACES|nr:DUF4926 domain-containing protein [Saccharothrix espanaensis]CCH33090.1 hypothetical protein BN6_58320 [Saccharothrix espanaensis DSM 44229]